MKSKLIAIVAVGLFFSATQVSQIHAATPKNDKRKVVKKVVKNNRTTRVVRRESNGGKLDAKVVNVQVNLNANHARLFDLWKVQLIPSRNMRALPKTVLVRATDSRQAAIAAMKKNPGYQAGAIARVK